MVDLFQLNVIELIWRSNMLQKKSDDKDFPPFSPPMYIIVTNP